MTRPHSACWIIAATAMVILLSPSPAGVSDREPGPSPQRPAARPLAAFDAALGPWDVERLLAPYPVGITSHQFPAFAPRPATPLGAAAFDVALGPWDIERWLVPYPTTLTLGQLAQLAPQPVMPAAQLPSHPSAPVDSALGPWRIEQFVCPYQITVASRRLDEPAGQAARPPFPAIFDAALGPWDVERMLLPYPATVAPDLLQQFCDPLAEPLRPAAFADKLGPHERLALRATGTARRLLGLLKDGAQAARKAIPGLRPPKTSTWGGQTATPDRGGQAVPTRTDDALDGLKQLIEALDAFAPRPASWPDDDRGSFLLPWREAPQTASDPFALEQRWTDADDGPTIALQAILPADDTLPPQHVAGLERLFPPSTGIAFLAALLLISASRSYAAGAVYGYARDGPLQRR